MVDTLVIAIAGTIGAVAKGAWDRIWQNVDKRRERNTQLSEVHRNELRQAYADFIAMHGKQHDAATKLVVTQRQIAQIEQGKRIADSQASYGAEQKATAERVAQNLVASRARLFDDVMAFKQIVTESQNKGATVLLLEHDETYGDLVREVMTVPPSLPANEEERQSYLSELGVASIRAADLVKALQGRFSPVRWHKPVKRDPTSLRPGEDAPKQIEGSTSKHVEAETEPKLASTKAD